MSPNTTNEGRITRSVEVQVMAGGQAARLTLGLQYGTDPSTNERRQLWGVVDNCGRYLTHMAYSVRDANPAMLIHGMEIRGHDVFRFHTGIPIEITPEELLRAGRALDIVAPEMYQGVPVPEVMLPNWNEIEAEWWRRGVRAAVEHLLKGGKPAGKWLMTEDGPS